MKNIIFLIMLSFSAAAQTQDYFLGFWSDKNKAQTIEIYKDSALYYGKIIDSKNADTTTSEHRIVLLQMTKRNPKTLYGGTFRDFQLNQEYEVKLKLKDKNTIRFIRVDGFLAKSQIWHRIPE